MEEPEAEWVVREERVATQSPDFPKKLVGDEPAETPEPTVVQTTEQGGGQILPGGRLNRAGRISSAQSVVRRVPAYDFRWVRVVRYVTGVLEVMLGAGEGLAVGHCFTDDLANVDKLQLDLVALLESCHLDHLAHELVHLRQLPVCAPQDLLRLGAGGIQGP